MLEIEESRLITFVEGDLIVLDNLPMRVEGGVGYQLTNVYGRKSQQGEPGPDDHPINSTYTQRTWVGGLLIKNLQESADVGKAWDGLAWTQTRGALSAPLKVVQLALPDGLGGVVTPHARLGDCFYYTAGQGQPHILEMVESGHTLRHPGGGEAKTINAPATNRGVVFRVHDDEDTATEELYIPTIEGYTRMGVTFALSHAPVGNDWWTVGFATHEDKLWRLTTGGQVFMAMAHDDTWEWMGTIPDGSVARNIMETYDDDGNRCIGVSTSTGLFLLDADNKWFFATDLSYPEHAYQGFGLASWRGDQWLSVGVGLHRKSSGLITARGLDADDGLPAELAGGFIADIEPSYNLLVVAVAGTNQGEGPAVYQEIYGLSQGLPYPMVGKGEAEYGTLLGRNRKGAIYAWNGLGWSKLVEMNRPPTRVAVSMVRNPDRDEFFEHMFWGDVDGGAYTMHIPATYYNPLLAPNLPLARRGRLVGSHIDWDQPDIPKIAKQLNIKVDKLWDLIGEVEYANQVRLTVTWHDLDGIPHRSDDPDLGSGPYPFVINGARAGAIILPPAGTALPWTRRVNKRYSIPLGWNTYRSVPETLLATGLPHERIGLDIEFLGDGYAISPEEEAAYRLLKPDMDLTSGVVEWYTIIARRWMRPHRVWSFQVDATIAVRGASESDVVRFLNGVCLKKEGVPFVTGEEQTIVDVSVLDGTDTPGLTPDSYRTVTCVEFTDITYETEIR